MERAEMDCVGEVDLSACGERVRGQRSAEKDASQLEPVHAVEVEGDLELKEIWNMSLVWLE